MESKKKLEIIFTILMLISIVSAVANIIFFVFTNDNMYLFISMISLFIVGITILVLVLKNDDNDERFLDKYVVLDKDEYENMKNTLFKQEKEIKKLKAIIKR